ncbi:hypothetical protein M2158_004055 [Streptomyces sp. SAI-144]|uniref:hypothetical protein n=1 Tax=Streptomyces sp. SAI-144 TaxID=2940544 RepID=UPI002474AA85|nr:hypothetical protein [Streptomyces sp. SAI-144]MDH6435578.1 hypothetical protein [Streptomyces sp. SAI-144]
MSGPCDCLHCTSPAAEAEVPREPEQIVLPDRPTPIRVHTADAPPFDCVLYPDGSLTAVINGQRLRNMLTLADMLDMNWSGALVEFNPAPLPEDSAPEPVVEAVQEVLAL